MKRPLILVLSLLLPLNLLDARETSDAEYQRRVDTVRAMPGFVALWDFVKRDPATGNFNAHQPAGAKHDFRLDPVNYVRDYWGEGREATNADFPLLGRGPFGQAVKFQAETDNTFRPCLLVPRERLHDTGLDVKGPGHSISMVAWVLRENGIHAIAGIWHEGTDLEAEKRGVQRVEKGRRQYCIFAGLAAKSGASAVHVSENGARSFGDIYARNLAVTPELIPSAPKDASDAQLDATWSAVGFVFDNDADTATAYVDGQATEFWIENPAKHGFFKWPANGWLQAQLHRQEGLQEGEDPNFPPDQFYTPPEGEPTKRESVSESDVERVELHHFPFTRVRVTLGRDGAGEFRVVKKRELAALKVNPFWFPHNLYDPGSAEEGGPFTIGRVIHVGRSNGFLGYIGGVAVFDSVLTPGQMKQLSDLAKASGPDAASDLLHHDKIQKP